MLLLLVHAKQDFYYVNKLTKKNGDPSTALVARFAIGSWLKDTWMGLKSGS